VDGLVVDLAETVLPPQPRGHLHPRLVTLLVDVELDQRRGVEVGAQPRSWKTMSESAKA
jgi:hypothetical protein